MKKTRWTEKEEKLLKKNYSDHENVYLLFPSRSTSSINHKAHKLKLRRLIKKRKYPANHHFFKKITPEMMYTLGLFFSDGNVSHKKDCISIHLNKKDSYLLKKISNIMKSNRPIFIDSTSANFRINSKILSEDLINLGCPPRKSKILEFPKINDRFLSHFIRGYFDGDGSISFNKPNTIKIYFLGTKKFLIELRNKLNKKLYIKNNPLYKTKSIWRLHYYGDDARKICSWMYKNSKDLYLKRKQYRFEEHIRKRKNGI